MVFCAPRFALATVVALVGSSCSSSSSSSGSTDDEQGSSDGSSTGSGVGGGGEFLGCPDANECAIVMVSQTLDDRVEIFAPEATDGIVYRGAIDLDLKENPAGDNSGENLDEPFGLARTADGIQILVGHYPSRVQGTLLTLPLSYFEDRAVGEVIPSTDLYDGSFINGAVGTALGEEEPIFVHVHRSGRMLIGVFNNDFFTVETSWTNPGKLLVVDPTDPGAFGTVELSGLANGSCNGAGQLIELDADKVAVTCDGNEAVAILNLGDIGTGSAQAAAAAITGTLCDIGFLTSDRRFRYLARDGSNGVIVAEGPTPFDPLSSAALYRIDGDSCAFGAPTTIGELGQVLPGEIVAYPGDVPTWLVAHGGGGVEDAPRGIFVAADLGGSELTICGPMPGFETAWETDGDVIDPFALALTPDGRGLAVGAGAFSPETEDAIYGRVFWASLSSADDPCDITATVTDLTDGGPGRAPAVDPSDPSTWRRAPNVVRLDIVSG